MNGKNLIGFKYLEQTSIFLPDFISYMFFFLYFLVEKYFSKVIIAIELFSENVNIVHSLEIILMDFTE